MWFHGRRAPVAAQAEALVDAPLEDPVAPPPTGRDPLRARTWLAFLIGGLGVALGSAIVADETALQPVVTAAGFAGTAAILIGVRMNKPARRLPWHLVAVCTGLTTIGLGFLPRTGGLGIVGQAMTGAGYLAGIAGFVLLIRGRIPGGDKAALLDAAIVAAGTGVVIWAFGFAPYVAAARQSSLAAAAYFYPALVVSAMVLPMWVLNGAHRPATRLIVMTALVSNGIMILDMLRGLVGQSSFSGVYLAAQFASLAFIGAAALHPSMAVAPDRLRTDPRPIGRRRILALTLALLVNPATLAIEIWSGHAIDPAPYLIGGAVIGILVIARLGDALRHLGASLHERESLMELLRRQALYDALTSLPNRSYFTDRLAAEFANRSTDRPLAVLLIDLDDFKAVNDGHGHEAGDALLVAVGQRLRASIRDGDMAARLGGDEFVIVLPSCTDATVPTRVAQRILRTFGDPFDIGGHSLSVQVSIGVAIAGLEERTADDLVRNADLAMYLAKGRGKGRFELFEPAMLAAAASQIELRTDLEAAIADGDLRLHFQPVIDLRTGRTVGFEALVRWQHGGRLIPPGEFIPLAEGTGLIGPLTDWVVAEACRTTAASVGTDERPWVSVNLSSSQLVRQDLVGLLGRHLKASGLSADRLVVEITESSLVEIEVARPAIERLNEIGVRLAIDDFGTGYSALSYLARLPIDIIKIDRSFVVALEQAGPEEAIAAAIIALAKRLGLTTIGEGIETAAQVEQLSSLGCDLGQGFYLGRPAAREYLDAGPVPAPAGRRRRQSSLSTLGA